MRPAGMNFPEERKRDVMTADSKRLIIIIAAVSKFEDCPSLYFFSDSHARSRITPPEPQPAPRDAIAIDTKRRIRVKRRRRFGRLEVF